MLEFLKNLGRPKPVPTYRDSVFGQLTRNVGGVWCGEVAFRNFHVKVLLPGAEYQPSSMRLALARALAPEIQAKVESALDYVAEVNPKLWRGKLWFSALNLVQDAGVNGFALDFVSTGDMSGNCWRVRFDGGQPVQADYTQRAG